MSSSKGGNNEKLSGYKSGLSHIIGIILIVVGALSASLNIITIGLTLDMENYSEVSGWQSLAYVAHGLWCGFVFVLTGCYGVAARGQRRRLVVTFAVLSIVSAMFALIQFAISIAGAVVSAKKGQANYGCNTGSINAVCQSVHTLIAMESLLAASAIGAFILSIFGAINGCSASRSSRDQRPNLPNSFSSDYQTATTAAEQDTFASFQNYPAAAQYED